MQAMDLLQTDSDDDDADPEGARLIDEFFNNFKPV